jgi:hypothetical protein
MSPCPDDHPIWARLPNRAIGPPHRPTLAPADKKVLAQALARASSASARISQSPGAPPHSGSWYRPKKPISARSAQVSGGRWPALSTEAARGAMRSWQKRSKVAAN